MTFKNAFPCLFELYVRVCLVVCNVNLHPSMMWDIHNELGWNKSAGQGCKNWKIYFTKENMLCYMVV